MIKCESLIIIKQVHWNSSNCMQIFANFSGVTGGVVIRAFSVAGPQVWNCLPPEVTSAPSLVTFRTRL